VAAQRLQPFEGACRGVEPGADAEQAATFGRLVGADLMRVRIHDQDERYVLLSREIANPHQIAFGQRPAAREIGKVAVTRDGHRVVLQVTEEAVRDERLGRHLHGSEEPLAGVGPPEGLIERETIESPADRAQPPRRRR